MSFFISLFLIVLGFLPFLLVLNKAKIINLSFVQSGFLQFLNYLKNQWRILGSTVLTFALILSPSMNLLANSTDLDVSKIKQGIDSAVISQHNSSKVSSVESITSNTSSSISSDSKEEISSSLSSSSESRAQSQNSSAISKSSSALSSISSYVVDDKSKQEIKDKKIITQEGITAEIPAGTIITAGDGKDLLSKEVIVDKKDKQEVAVKNDETEKKAEVVFELGNPAQHLVFSKPVKVEVPVVAKDGDKVTIGVKHFGQSSFGTDSIVDQNGNAKDVFEVKDSKVIFYTLGASTFTVTSTSGIIAFTSPANGGVISPASTITGTGSINGAAVTLANSVPTNIGTATVTAGIWSIIPIAPLPLGSNTICANGSTTNCITFSVDNSVFPYNTVASPRIYSNTNPTNFTTGAINTNVSKSVTVNNMSLPDTKISGGQYQNCAINSINKLYCWGYQPYGQLGIGSVAQVNVPTLTTGIPEDVYTVDTAIYNTCGVGFSGKVYCAGYGLEGQLGNGANAQSNSFVQVSGITNAISVSVGERTACAALSSNGVKCWGQDFYNELGDGTALPNVNTPQFVSGTSTKKYLKVASANGANCALDIDGAVTCWGYNGEGQIGDGTNTQATTPKQVIGLDRGVKNIYSSEERFFCAVKFDGSVVCWGQATNGGAANSNVPVTVSGLTNIKSMALGQNHGCATSFANEMKCWNYNDYGKSQGVAGASTWTPTVPVGMGVNITDVSVSEFGSCGQFVNGTLKCWGYNGSGQVGDGTVIDKYAPVDVSGFNTAGSVAIASAASNLSLTNYALTGADASNFSIASGTCLPAATLVPSQSCNLNLGFTSPTFGTKNAQLIVTENAINDSNPNLIGSVVRTPGGVSGSVLWTKSDDSSCVVATNCVAWKDNSQNNNPVEAVGSMQLQPGDKDHNYQPWFTNFSGTNYFLDDTGSISPANVATTTEQSIFSNARPSGIPAAGARITGSDNDNGVAYSAEPGLGVYNGFQAFYRYWNFANSATSTNAITDGKASTFGWVINNNAASASINQSLDGKNSTNSNIGNAPHTVWGDSVSIGNATYPYALPWKGDIQEVIWFNKALDATEKKQLESYLAIKSGVTLDQSTAQDYIASNGTTKVWNSATGGIYKNNIAVIGRDDSGSLNQKQSIAATQSPERISISRGSLVANNTANTNSFASDLSFLSSADNNLTGTTTLDTAACPGPTTSTLRTKRVFQLQSRDYSESTTVSADWLGSYYNPNGKMYMIVADDDTFVTNRVNIPMTKNGTSWDSLHTIPANSTKYISFIGEDTVANLMSGDKEINWIKTPWNGGSYLPGTLGWGPGTMNQTQGDTNFTMKWTDSGNTSYAKSIWSGYPSYYPLSVGDTTHWVGLDTGTPDPVTFEVSASKAAKSSSFVIHGIDSYYYNDSVKVEGFLNGSAVSPKLTDYSGYLDSVSKSGNVATGTDYWGNRWYPFGDVKVNFDSPVDKILVTYKPTSTLPFLWWQEFSIGNIKFKGAKPAPTYTPADGIYIFKEVSPTTVELGEEQTVDFKIQNLNCANKTINFSDVLPNGTYVADTLIGQPTGTVNTYTGTNTLSITNAVIPAGITNMSVKLKATAVGNYQNQATFSIGSNNYTSDLESTIAANDASPYNVVASTKQIANMTLTKSADVSQVLQNGIITYTYTIKNNSTTPTPLTDITDTLSGAQKYVTGTLVNPLTGGNVIGNNGVIPPGSTYGGGNIMTLKGYTIPVGTSTITIQANVNAEPVGNILKNKFDVTVLDPAYQAYHKDSNETSVTIVNTLPTPTFPYNTVASPRIFTATNPTDFGTTTTNTDVNKTATVFNAASPNPNTSITAGFSNTCAITEASNLKCWGYNAGGQTGDNGGINPWTMVNVYQAAIGNAHGCAIDFNGGAKCWGYNPNGQIGTGTAGGAFGTPQQVVGLTSGANSISTGYYTTCATIAAGGIKCWGAGNSGQLGNGTNTSSAALVDVSGTTTTKYLQVVGGGSSVNSTTFCALNMDGAVSCWGNGSNVPVIVTGLEKGVSQISETDSNTFCAVMADDTVKCWGSGASGQLGNGTNSSSTTPVTVTGLNNIKSVVVGADNSCALTNIGGVKCWGNNSKGQTLGTVGANVNVPTDVAGLTSGVVSIAAGNQHTCAVLTTGEMKCWGAGTTGQLGNGASVDNPTPTTVTKISLPIKVASSVQAVDLNISSIVIDGVNANNFSSTGGTCGNSITLTEMQTCTVDLKFNSPTAGTKVGSLNITENAINENDVNLQGVVTAPIPSIIIGANVLDYNAGGSNTGIVGNSYCKDFGNITGAPGCLTTVSLSGQNGSYNEYAVVISTNPQPTAAITNTAYAYSTDNVCDATDTWIPTTFIGTAIESSSATITDESHNGQYICARMNFGGTTIYKASTWQIKVDRTDPVVTITDNGNTAPASSDLIKIAVTDAGGNIPTKSYYRLVSTQAACVDLAKPYETVDSTYFPEGTDAYTEFLIADGITFTNPGDNGKFVCIQTRDTTDRIEQPYSTYNFNRYYNFTKTVTTALNISGTPLNVTINQATTQGDLQLIGTTTPVKFTATFNQDIDEATLANSDFTRGGTATGCSVTGFVANPSGQKKIYDVNLNCDTNIANNNKTITLSMTAGKVKAAAGFDNTASTSTDNSVTLTTTIPTLGSSVPTTTSPLTGTTGGTNMSALNLTGSNLSNGTIASFLPAGTTTPILGTIQGGNFVPNSGQIIPANATTGPATGVVSSAGVPSVNVPTNFSAPVTSSSVTSSVVTLSSQVTSSSVASSSITSSSTTADTTAPAAPTINPVKSTDTVVTGKTEPGSTVTVTKNGTPIVCTNAPVIADTSGNYSCNLPTGTTLTFGDVISSTAKDPAGNVSAPTQTTVANVTTVSPSPTATASTTPTINPINSLDKTITGIATPGATVNLVDGSGNPIACTNAPVIVNGAGQYTCNITTPIATGTVVKATATEPGKTPSTQALTTVSNSATTAPSAPALYPTDGSPITGTGTPGNTVSVKDSTGNPVCTPDPIVAANGTWSCVPAVIPTDGALIKATQTNPAGVTSGPATTIVDQTPPVAPVCVAQANKTVICTGVTVGDTVTIPGTICSPSQATTSGTVTCTLINLADPAPTAPVTTTDPATNTTASPVIPFVSSSSSAVSSAVTLSSAVSSSLVSSSVVSSSTISTSTVSSSTISSSSVSTPSLGSFTPNAPVTGTTGSAPPTIPLNGSNLPDGTVASFLPGGSTTPITGTIVGGNFVPNAGQTIPTNVTPGASSGVLSVTSPTGVANLTIPTNFSTPTASSSSAISSSVVSSSTISSSAISSSVVSSSALTSSSQIASSSIASSSTTTSSIVVSPSSTVNSSSVVASSSTNSSLTNSSSSVTTSSSTTSSANSSAIANDTTAPSAPTVNPIDSNDTVIKGKAEPGATINITGATCINAPIIADASGNYNCNLAAPLAPNTLVSVTAKDVAGNVSTPSTATVSNSTNSDPAVPLLPTQSKAPSLNPVSSLDRLITGTANLGSTVSITGATCTNAPVIADANGKFVCNLAALLASNTVITATATEPGLTASTPSTTTVNNAATTAPSAPVVNPTNGSPITGLGEPGATVNVKDPSGNVVCTTIVQPNGTWSCTPTTIPSYGTPLTVTQSDPQGNVSGPSTIVVDQTPPTAPTCTTTPNGNVTCTGTTPGDTVSIPGATCTPSPASASGIVVCIPNTQGTPITGPGAVRDPAGNTTPVIVNPPASAPTINPSNGSSVSGTGTPGSTINIKDSSGNPVACTPSPTIVAANGTFTCTLTTPLANGAVLSITQTTNGSVSAPANVTVDTVPPTAPVCQANGNGTVICSGTTPGDTVTLPNATCSPSPATSTGIVVCTPNTPGTPLTGPVITKDSSGNTVPSTIAPASSAPTVNPSNGGSISGTGTPGNAITVKDSSGNTLCTTTVQANGTYSCVPSPTPANGSVVSVTQTNPATGATSSPTTNTIDSVPPAAPVCTTSPNPSNGSTALTVSCTGVENGATVTLLGTTCTPTPATATGIVNCVETTPGSLPNNPTLIVTDPTGNSLPVIVPYTKDTTPPTVPTCTTSATNVVTCTGTTPGDTVSFLGATCSPSPATASGTVICTPTNQSVPPAGPITVKDPAGNTATTPVPAPGAIGTPSVGTVGGQPASSTTSAATNNTKPVITGTGTPGDNITVKDQNGNTICTTTATATGTWTCTPTTPLAQSNYDFTATASNPTSGISSTPSLVAKAIIDTTAPAAPTVTSPVTGGTTTNPTPTFIGNGESGATVIIKDEAGNTVCTTVVPASGPWTCPFTVPQPEGKHTYLVSQTDPAGNSSANSSPVIITFDIDTDSAPLAMENAGPNSGDANGDGTPDASQGNVATKSDTANSNFYTSLDLGNTGCNGITNFDFTPEAPLATQDVSYDYPIGLFIFKAKCATPAETLNITFVLDKIYNTTGWTYRKYNTVTSTYQTLPGVTYGTRLVGGVSKTTINFSVVEGGPFDEDGVANGVFSDPSGPSIAVTPANSGNGGGTITIGNGNSSLTNNSNNSNNPNQSNNPASSNPNANNNSNSNSNNSNGSTSNSANGNNSDKNPIQKTIQDAVDLVLPRTGGATVSLSVMILSILITLAFVSLKKKNEEK